MALTIRVAGLTDAKNLAIGAPQKLSLQAVLKMSKIAYDYIQGEADTHTKTGALFQSVVNRDISSFSLNQLTAVRREVGHDTNRAPHAAFVVFGTRAHRIEPRIADGSENFVARRYLRFVGRGGDFVFARSVWHPGYAGDDYITRGAVKALDAFRQIFDDIDLFK